MNRILVVLLGSFLFFACNAMAHAGPELESGGMELAEQRRLDRSEAMIRNAEELALFLSAEPATSPLRAMNTSARQLFLSSLVFSERGLASYSIKGLAGLGVAQRHRILGLFGEQASLAAFDQQPGSGGLKAHAGIGPPMQFPEIDYPGYKCVGKGTCEQSFRDTICIGDNC